MKKTFLALALTILTAANAAAECKLPTVSEAQDLIKVSGAKALSVKPVGDLTEVLVEKQGRKGVIYIDCARKYAIQGMVVDLKTAQRVLAHEKDFPTEKGLTQIDPKQIPNKAIIMGSKKTDKILYVFTDPDCPFCRQLHPILQQIVKKRPDISVHVMLMPIPSLHPQAFGKVQAIQASQSLSMLDDAFAGKAIQPVKGNAGKEATEAVMAFAAKAGINGTPSMFNAKGQVVQSRDVDAIIKSIDGV